MPEYKTESGNLFYSIQGQGKPITLIHGVGADHESWKWVSASLAEQYRILTMDLRGHGQSVKSAGPYDLLLFRDDILGLLDHVGINQTHLVGFSLGGLIAQRLAIDAPKRLITLAIISSVAGRTQEEKDRVVARAAKLKHQGAASHLTDAVDRWFTDVFREQNPEIMEWRRLKSLQNDPESYAAAYQVLASNDLVDELALINTPTLAVTGEFDVGSTPRMSHVIASHVKRGRAMILPGLKHSLLLEAPNQIALAISNFITENDSKKENEDSVFPN